MTAAAVRATRRLLAAEVVQTSAMDCGPASLKCLAEGFHIPVSYDRLREACQTDVDGTSINTLGAVARALGLDAEQVMLPADHVLLDEARALPALAVVRLPSGLTHFMVIWRRHGRWVQVMDPAVGRRWISGDRLRQELYSHIMTVPAAAWRSWAGSDDFRGAVSRRMRAVGGGGMAAELLADASADEGWHSLAALDAAVRFTEALVRAGGLRAGRQAAQLLRAQYRRAAAAPAGSPTVIGPSFWSVRPAPDGADGSARVRIRGAVLLRIRGRRAPEGAVKAAPTAGDPPARERAASATVRPTGDHRAGAAALTAALTNREPRTERTLLGLLRGDGVLGTAVLAAALVAAAGTVVLEALLLRGAMAVGGRLGLLEQRLQAGGAMLAFAAALLALESGLVARWFLLGRRLEVRLRLRFVAALRRLPERYLQSRPASDMAERLHNVHRLRALPPLAGHGAQVALQLGMTALAIAWIDPALAGAALAAAVAAIGIPLATAPLLGEQDLRVRTHTGALGRYYLDALLGLVAVRAHGAESVVRREHESLLAEWVRAGRRRLRLVTLVDALQAVTGFGLAAWLLFAHAGTAGGASLLVAYWALNLPVLGEELATLLRQYPMQRNVARRLLEPLRSAPEAPEAPGVPDATARSAARAPDRSPGGAGARGVALALDGVRVLAAGRPILTDVTLRVAPGEHVAVVGRSGAGKSSLVATILGLHEPAAGSLTVDGRALTPDRATALRARTAWIDPAVQLWNRSLLDNLLYGAEHAADPGHAVGDAALHGIIARLPDGLQGRLGEGGGLLSGGEGQRVRIGRALLRRSAGLVLLDEPCRGLPREQRAAILCRARARWAAATLLCVTHDVAATLDFERVVVMEGGRVVEDDAPSTLAADATSRYRAMLDAAAAVDADVWRGDEWRRVRLDDGCLSVEPAHVGR